MRRLAFVAVGLFCASSVEAQLRPVKVKSCAFADSLLGEARDDTRGYVRGFYEAGKDSTYLLTLQERGQSRLSFYVKLAGKPPTRDPAVQLDVWLRGDTARSIASYGSGMPELTIVLDDSTRVVPGSVAFGRFEGPAGAPVTLPISALIPADEVVTVAEARRIVVRIEKLAYSLSPSERRDLRAILRVAVCPP